MSRAPQDPYDSPTTVPSARRSSFVVALLTATSLFAGATLMILVVLIGPFVWILRDGLGPAATNSTGIQAMSRMFWTFYWGPATVVATLAFGGASFLRRKIIYSKNRR